LSIEGKLYQLEGLHPTAIDNNITSIDHRNHQVLHPPESDSTYCKTTIDQLELNPHQHKLAMPMIPSLPIHSIIITTIINILILIIIVIIIIIAQWVVHNVHIATEIRMSYLVPLLTWVTTHSKITFVMFLINSIRRDCLS